MMGLKMSDLGVKAWLPVWLAFSLCILSPSCTEAPPPVMSYKDRELVDSLFRVQVDSLRPILDSLCLVHFDSALQYNVDSMMTIRQQEIKRYLERVRKETQQ